MGHRLPLNVHYSSCKAKSELKRKLSIKEKKATSKEDKAMSIALYERNVDMYTSWKRRGSDRCLRWIGAECGQVPEGAVQVGYLGGKGGEPIYLGRIQLPNGDTVPGNHSFTTFILILKL